MNSEDPQIIDKLSRLQALLVSCARSENSESDDREYKLLREELVLVMRQRLPQCVKAHRTLLEFRRFIQPKFKSYAERTAYISEQLSPLFIELEGLTDDMTNDVSKGSTATATQSGDLLKRRTVFVVYGRNEAVRKALFELLRALNLNPLEWSQVVKLTGQGSPYVGDVLDAGFAAAQATVVLLTPDDEARLRSTYQSPHDGPEETELTGQPRQNVLFEAGMAMGKHSERTIIVEFGRLRQMSDLGGRHVVRLNDSPGARNDLVQRLLGAGCDVNTSGCDWYSAGNFEAILTAMMRNH